MNTPCAHIAALLARPQTLSLCTAVSLHTAQDLTRRIFMEKTMAASQHFDSMEFEKHVMERRRTFAEKMDEAPKMGYEVIPLREEEGFTARLAVKKPHSGDARGMFVICPGGAFLYKAYMEAFPVSEYFWNKGINTAVLDYHVNTDRPVNETDAARLMAGQDGLQAIRFLRKNAEKYHILPDHIAIGGFSAGGMLSGYAATRFDYGNPDAADPLFHVSSRPDAALILYGAFSKTTSVPSSTGGMTREQIARANELDNNRNIRTDCPPMFVFQTHEDDPRIALNFCMELAVHGVPYEIHTFEEGRHGGALYDGRNDTPDIPHTALWAEIAADWLIRKGY